MSLPFKETYYDVPASGSTPVDIPVTIGVCRRMDIVETQKPEALADFNPQGTVFKYLLDNFASLHVLGAGEPLTLQDEIEVGNAGGRTLGHGQIASAGHCNYQAATVVLKFVSQTATATKVRVREY
jgi:hypothetical protein